MKRIKSKILIIFIFINILLIGLFPLNSKAIDDLTFTFNDNVLFDSDISTFNDSFNLRNQQEYTEVYNATYTFTNEVGLRDTNISFVDSESFGVGSTLEVISELDGHSEVFKAIPIGVFQLFKNNFISQTEGTFEFWYRRNSTSIRSIVNLLQSNGSEFLLLQFESNGNIAYSRLGIGNTVIGTYQSNQWIHFSIDFNVNTELFNITVNGIKNLNLNASRFPLIDYTNVASLSFQSSNDVGNSKCLWYIDAIGYSWGLLQEIDDFNDDTVGLNPPHWIDDDGLGTNTESSIDDFSFPPEKIMTLFDYNTSAKCNTSRIFPSNSTAVEWQMAITSFNTTLGFFSLREGNSFILSVRFSNENIFSTNGSETFNISNSNIIDIFSLFKIDLFYDTNTYDIYLNGSLLASDLDFLNRVSNHITTLELATSIFPEGYNFYVDNITFYKSYEIGNNIIPYILIDTILKEVDKYEFAMSGINTLNVIGASTYGTWTESDVGGGEVQIKEHPLDSNNRVVQIDTFDGGDVKGLRKNNFSLTGNFIDITIEFEIILMSGSTSYNIVAIESSDGNTITGFIMWHNGSLGWFPDISSAGVPLRDDLTTGKVYTLQVLLNYELDLFFLDWFIDGVFNESYIKPLIATGKSGLKEIFIRSHWVDNQARMELYSVGVYENGVSESKEIGWSVVDLQVSDWNPHIYNLFNILGNGVMNLGIISGNYSVGENFSGFVGTINLTNVLKTLNFYEIEFFNLTNPSIVFSIKGKDFSTSHLKIDGVKLIEGSNEYSLIFESKGVDIDEGYFFVVGTKLHFYHISDDSSLEFIQARFNINDISSTGFLTSFRSNIDNNAKGYFRVNYTTTSNIIQLPIIETTTRFILTQNRTIHDLVILITDNNINTILGLTEGFIYQIKLLQVENLLISVITTSLITMMIPLLIILVPTFAFSNIYGKALIIPMFILISLILTITGIIPIWLFFIIGISNSVLIIKKDKEMS